MTRIKWTDEMLAAEAAKYQTRSKFEIGSRNAYKAAVKRKMLDAICGHMEGNVKWTDEMLFTEAAKYLTRHEFEKCNLKAYRAARHRKLLNDICGHMICRFVWTDEILFNEANKYQTRVHFQRKSKGAYHAALRKNMLDEICSHMVDSPKSDNDAIYIWRAEREYFNGNPVYKIGITSWRLGQRRVNMVAKKAGFESSIIVFQKVPGKATDLENKLLALGDDPKYAAFNGSTEFRALSPAALDAALAIVSEAI
jgi:hypothetical protein